MPATTSLAWDSLRAHTTLEFLQELIAQSEFLRGEPVSISHIRTAHYAVFRIVERHNTYVVRVGITQSTPYLAVNSGVGNSVTNIEHDQSFEYEMGLYLSAHNASVITPIYYERHPSLGIDMMWLPFIADCNEPISTEQWHDTLLSLENVPDPGNLPIFNNRQKTMNRLGTLPMSYSVDKARQYDEILENLFQKATKWGMVHGDLHCDNAINTGEKVLMYDLDTLCWGPLVWDLTHLATRTGQGMNTSYSVDELRVKLGFTHEEFQIAVELRRLAAEIAHHARTTEK